jgi:hypothetical protein
MIQVYKCDFCYHFKQDAEEMRTHEAQCSFNPIKKTCYSCRHEFDEGAPISGSMPACRKGLDTVDGMGEGNCIGWELNLD